ncbi:putative stage IV sporulation protein YqfD [Clostridium liquoris]|uniref:Putative stage IV sporulation protein YqfD n=1 Tax=Clostridium liquoris TaxID=1289519 RepID=A0A2T0B0V5_9CLOT|nr:putative stage IV sporulation protein YqfD [Clostridium liquoris]
MSKISLNKYKKSTITMEIQSFMPEKFINLLWKNNIDVKNIKKKDLTTFVMDIRLKDYEKIEGIAKKTDTKVKITNRKGAAFFLLKARKRRALLFGIAIFAFIIYYLSTFIWRIDIETDKNLTPYEIRRQLLSYGVKEGIPKKNLNVLSIEEKIMENNESIMWIRIRVEGSILKVTASERQTPPNIVQDEDPCNLIAKADGQIVRVYTTAGTAVVKKGDLVKKGDVLVKGEQGREGNIYEVHANGYVIARTFYEEVKNVKTTEVKRERTGNKLENIYIKVGKKKVYIKKSVNKFTKYDKIENNKGPIVFENYYEINEKSYNLDKNKIIENTSKELIDKITLNFDKNIQVIDKIVEHEQQDEGIRVRVLVVAEENIALTEKINQS